MNNNTLDLPVFMIFFNRPDTLKLVFEAVRQAKPSKLFLACDGPRPNNKNDFEKVAECKKIVEAVDWDCEVYKNYSQENLGCGMRMYSGLNWAFEYVDRIVILEDDCVPSQDFFMFCYELLEKYKDDKRIYSINAMNHLGVYDKTPYSYFYGEGCCWAWATWKRSWDLVDYQMKFLDDEYAIDCVESSYPYYSNYKQVGIQRRVQLHSKGRLSAWTYQNNMACALHSCFCIVPKYNMVTNIGLTDDSGHATNDIRKIEKKKQAYFGAPTYQMDNPLKHPKFVVEDRRYYELVNMRFRTTVFSRLEGVFRRFIFGSLVEKKQILNKLFIRLRIGNR